MTRFQIDIPDCDASGKEVMEVDVHDVMRALYEAFGWEKGSVRVLVAQITSPEVVPRKNHTTYH